MPNDSSVRSALDRHSDAAFNVLQHDLLADMAAALAHQEAVVEKAMVALRSFDAATGTPEDRLARVRSAAKAVWAFFVQRELCGFRDHKEVIAHYAIPGEVLVRLGAIEPDHK